MPAKRPNIVVICTHDTGCHFGCYGVPTVHTPAIDALAADGVRLTQMFATSAICSPSRGSLMTGKYPQTNGLIGLAGQNWGWELSDPTQHLSHVLQGQGYFTAFFGAQHETADIATLGFDHRCRGADRATDVARRAAEYLTGPRDREQGKPLFMQIGFFETHTPYVRNGVQPDTSRGVFVPPYCNEDPPDLREHLAALQGSVREVDDAVAIILSALRDAGIEDDTLILFTTDHGPELPRAKWMPFDPGWHVAFILRWPQGGLCGGRTVDAMCSNIDFLPTLAELAGFDAPPDVDGVSFKPALENPAAVIREEAHSLFVYGKWYALRTQRYKFVRNFDAGTFLYDLQSDPLELTDLAKDPAHANAYADMNARLWRWLESVQDPVLRGRVPMPTDTPEKSTNPPSEIHQRMLEEYRATR